MELNIEAFSPKKAELIAAAEKYRSLKIRGVEDEDGYVAVDAARKDLKSKRCEIQKTGKELRAEAIAFQKAVIAKEKEYVGIIEPLELELEAKQEAIDKEREMNARRGLLPQRKSLLKEMGIDIDDEAILLMDNGKFQEFYNQKKEQYLAEKERAMNEEKTKIENERRIAEAREQARREAEERGKKELELQKMKAKEAVEKERKKAQEAQKMAEEARERVIAEQKDAADKIEKERIAAAKKLEGLKKYQAFLKSHGWTKENEDEFVIQREGDLISLFKKVGEFNAE
jgi:hypothetical protein